VIPRKESAISWKGIKTHACSEEGVNSLRREQKKKRRPFVVTHYEEGKKGEKRLVHTQYDRWGGGGGGKKRSLPFLCRGKGKKKGEMSWIGFEEKKEKRNFFSILNRGGKRGGRRTTAHALGSTASVATKKKTTY